jgi:acyl-CoA thioesterase-1
MMIFRMRACVWPIVAACVMLTMVSACSGSCSSARESTAQAPGAASGSAAPADPDAEPECPKVVALGDSLTAGFGLVESESYPAVLQQRINDVGYEFEVVNAGVSGDTSAGGLRRLDWSLDGDVRVLIVALGGNDGLRGLSIREMQQNLTTIIERARERNIVVILAGMEAPPNYGPEYVESFRVAYREIAMRQRVLFIPFLLDQVAGESTLNQADGIHPNAAGARIIAATVWSVLKPILDSMAGFS